MNSDFNDHHLMQKTFTDKYFWSNQLKKEVDEHVRKIYPEIPYSGDDVAQAVNNFLYHWWKEMESAENSITIDKNEGFSEKNYSSKHPSTTTIIDGTSISSAFCIERPKLFCCLSAH